MRRLRLLEPRGPWKAKGVDAPKGIWIMVCARCRRQGTMVRCGHLYGCADCVRTAGGREEFLRSLQQRQLPREELEQAMAEAGAG